MSFGLEQTGSDGVSTPQLTDRIEPGSLLEATPECLVVAQTDGRIVYANRHVEELTGFPRRELLDVSVGIDDPVVGLGHDEALGRRLQQRPGLDPIRQLRRRRVVGSGLLQPETHQEESLPTR